MKLKGVNSHIFSPHASTVTGEPLKDHKLPESKCEKIGKGHGIFNFLHSINHGDINKQANIKWYQIENPKCQTRIFPD